jgi:hypothetical protein
MGIIQSHHNCGRKQKTPQPLSRIMKGEIGDEFQENIDCFIKQIRAMRTIGCYQIENDNYYCRVVCFRDEPTITILPKRLMLEPVVLLHHTAYTYKDDTCCVCLENLVLQKLKHKPHQKKDKRLVKINQCQHVFHQECIQSTLDKCGEYCPLCRTEPPLDVIDNMRC